MRLSTLEVNADLAGVDLTGTKLESHARSVIRSKNMLEIFGFVTKICNALLRQSIILAVPKDIVRAQGRLIFRNDDAGSKQEVWRFHALIPVIDRHNHKTDPPYGYLH